METVPVFDEPSGSVANVRVKGKPSTSKGCMVDAENEDGDGGWGGAMVDNLVQVFWMGRHLPRGLGSPDDTFKWLKPKQGDSSLPERVWRRTRAFAFLGPQFEPDRTKRALVPGAAYTRALAQHTEKRHADRFHAFVSESHRRFDQELWFDEPIADGTGPLRTATLSQPELPAPVGSDQPTSTTGKQIIEYRALFVGGSKYQLGDRVEVRPVRAASRVEEPASSAAAGWAASSGAAASGAAGGQKLLGTVRALYELLQARERVAMVDVQLQTASHAYDGESNDPVESFLASSLVRKVDNADWLRREKALLNNRPSKLEWMECRLPGLKGQRPVSERCRWLLSTRKKQI